MLDPGKQRHIEEFLRQSLLGEELVNTQFHLFSAKSSSLGRVLKPRVLCVNNVLLAKASKYFLDLLSSDINPSDPSLIDLTYDSDVPSSVPLDDYGYESDSDLDDCNDPVPITKVEGQSAKLQIASKVRAEPRFKDDDEASEDGSESDSSDMFLMSPDQPGMDELFSVNKGGVGSVASSETAVQETGNKTSTNQTAIHLRSLASRHILVKDTAFQTWYTLLNYLYTDKFSFLPLSSATPDGQVHESLTSPLDEPRCSAKSMYRLACKVGLDDLRDEALSYIQQSLTEHNILKELSCNLVSKYPQLLEMELDVLYSNIASPSVVANFADLAKRVANGGLPHGADIIVGIHSRLLKVPCPLSREQATPASSEPFPVPLEATIPTSSVPFPAPLKATIPTPSVPFLAPLKATIPTPSVPFPAPLKATIPTSSVPFPAPLKATIPTSSVPFPAPLKATIPTPSVSFPAPLKATIPTPSVPYPGPLGATILAPSNFYNSSAETDFPAPSEPYPVSFESANFAPPDPYPLPSEPAIATPSGPFGLPAPKEPDPSGDGEYPGTKKGKPPASGLKKKKKKL